MGRLIDENISARRQRVLYHIRKVGSCEIQDLNKNFGVSEMTLRRDLAILESEGKVVRTRGHVEPTTFSAMELYWAARVMHDKPRKLAIGRATADLIEDGSVVGFDGSSTTYYVARNLVDCHLTVITNGAQILSELGKRPGIQVYVTGGHLREIGDLVGPHARRFAETANLDYYIFGVGGIDLETGMTEPTHEDTELKHVFLRQSKRNILVATSSKLGRQLAFKLASLDAIHTLVTDSDAPDEILDQIRHQGIEVVVAQVETSDSHAQGPYPGVQRSGSGIKHSNPGGIPKSTAVRYLSRVNDGPRD